MPKRVYLPHPMLDPAGEALLRKEVDVVLGAELDDAGRQAALAKAHGLSGGAGIDAAFMDRAPRLEVIGFPGSGYESIDVAAASERGIAVVPPDPSGSSRARTRREECRRR